MEDNPQSQTPTDTPNIPSGPETIHHRIGPSRKIFRGDKVTLTLPNELTKILNELMSQTDYWPDEIFARSLLLYKAAVDAVEEGERVAILDADGEVVQYITGL